MAKFPKRYLPKEKKCICDKELEYLNPLWHCKSCGTDFHLSNDDNVISLHYRDKMRLYIVFADDMSYFGESRVGDIMNFNGFLSFEESKNIIKKYLLNRIFE